MFHCGTIAYTRTFVLVTSDVSKAVPPTEERCSAGFSASADVVLHLYISFLHIVMPQEPSPLKSCIKELTSKPEGMSLPQKSMAQLNWLRTGGNHFKSNVVKMGLITFTECECGSIRAARHILISKPPCNVSDTNSEDLLEYLMNVNF